MKVPEDKSEIYDYWMGQAIREAGKAESGARGLRSIMDRILLDPMYDLPSRNDTTSKLIITPQCVRGNEAPRRYAKRKKIDKAV